MIPIAPVLDWLSPIDRLRDQARLWAGKVKNLIDTPVPPDMVAEKNRLIASAKTIKETVEKVLGQVDELNDIGLGAFPLVGAAVGSVTVAAAVAAVTKWTYDYNEFKERAGMYQDLIAQGVPGNQAAETVGLNKKSSAFISFDGLALPIMGLGALYLLTQMDK